MPSIITAPVRTRANNRGMQIAEVEEYVTLMSQVATSDDPTQLVLVDDSEKDTYEQAYARGERVRIAAKKFDLAPDVKIQVVAFQAETDGPFVAGVRFKA